MVELSSVTLYYYHITTLGHQRFNSFLIYGPVVRLDRAGFFSVDINITIHILLLTLIQDILKLAF